MDVRFSNFHLYDELTRWSRTGIVNFLPGRVSGHGELGASETLVRPCALGRPEVAGPQPSGIDEHALQHDARVHHPDFENVQAGLIDGLLGADLANAVLNRFFPVMITVAGGVAARHNR